MAASTDELISKLEEMVECAVCLEEFKHPKSLPCQHSFCTECLQGLLGTGRKIRCPCCNKKFPVPNGVRELPVDFRANSWLEIMFEYRKAKAARETEYAAQAAVCTTSVDPDVVSAVRQSGCQPGNYAPDHGISPQVHDQDAVIESFPQLLVMLENLATAQEGSHVQGSQSNTPPPVPAHRLPPVTSRRLPALPPGSSHGESYGAKSSEGQAQGPIPLQGLSQAPKSFGLFQQRPPSPPSSPRPDPFIGHSTLPRTLSPRALQLECEVPPPLPTSPRPSQIEHQRPLVIPNHPTAASISQSSFDNHEKAPPLPCTPRPVSLEHEIPPLPPKSFKVSKQSNEKVLFPDLLSCSDEDAPQLPRPLRPTQLHSQSLHVKPKQPVGPIFPPSTDETSPPPKLFRSSLQPKPDFEWV